MKHHSHLFALTYLQCYVQFNLLSKFSEQIGLHKHARFSFNQTPLLCKSLNAYILSSENTIFFDLTILSF